MLSIIVPVLNEEDSLQELFSQIERSCVGCGESFEVLFVDDGSTDGSWKVICDLATNHGQVGAIRLRRNFGKAAALTAGMRAACGDLILMMDADLQDDPAEILLLGVTKTHPAEMVAQALAAGLADVGENRVQEAEAKIIALSSVRHQLTWHLIGHLQSNKARKAAQLFDIIHSVDTK